MRGRIASEGIPKTSSCFWFVVPDTCCTDVRRMVICVFCCIVAYGAIAGCYPVYTYYDDAFKTGAKVHAKITRLFRICSCIVNNSVPL